MIPLYADLGCAFSTRGNSQNSYPWGIVPVNSAPEVDDGLLSPLVARTNNNNLSLCLSFPLFSLSHDSKANIYV